MHFGKLPLLVARRPPLRAAFVPDRLDEGGALLMTQDRDVCEREHGSAVAPEPLDRRLATVDQEVAVVVEGDRRVDEEVGGRVQQRDRPRQDHQRAPLVRIPAPLEDASGTASRARQIAAGEARHQQERKPEPARNEPWAG